jgi:hypothetical protein
VTDNPILAWLNNLPPVSVDPFVLRRAEDVTGVSGTGIVADGALFPAAGQNKAVVRWRGERGSTVVWDRIQHVKEIHGHDGRTTVELIPVGELIAALKAVVSLPSAPAYSDHPGHVATITGYNTALSDVRTAIISAIEALHDHDEDA